MLGWDLPQLGSRISIDGPDWDFAATVVVHARAADYGDFYDALGLPRPQVARRWTLEAATAQLQDAGLSVTGGDKGLETTTFADPDALEWYFTAVPWTVQGFSPERHRSALERIRTPLQVRLPAFWLRAVKA